MRLGDCGKTNLHTYSDKEKWRAKKIPTTSVSVRRALKI